MNNTVKFYVYLDGDIRKSPILDYGYNYAFIDVPLFEEILGKPAPMYGATYALTAIAIVPTTEVQCSSIRVFPKNQHIISMDDVNNAWNYLIENNLTHGEFYAQPKLNE